MPFTCNISFRVGRKQIEGTLGMTGKHVSRDSQDGLLIELPFAFVSIGIFPDMSGQF